MWKKMSILSKRVSRKTIEIMLSNSCACWFWFGIATLSRPYHNHNTFNRLPFYHNSRMNVPRILSYLLSMFVCVCVWPHFKNWFSPNRKHTVQVNSSVTNQVFLEFSRTKQSNHSYHYAENECVACESMRCEKSTNPNHDFYQLCAFLWNMKAISMKPNVTWLNGWSIRGLKCFRKRLNISLCVFFGCYCCHC